MQLSIQKSKLRSYSQRAFSLIELLLVIVIMGILIAIGSPYMLSSLEANKLTGAGSALSYKMSLAQQHAISTKQPVELRLFKTEEEGQSAFRAYQLVVSKTLADGTREDKPLENIERMGNGDVIILDGTWSPLLGQTEITNTDPKITALFGPTTYQKVVFYPDGSTNLKLNMNQCFVTLASARQLSSPNDPSNYYTVQIDPVTGRVKTYRP